ncbi:MAG TPA: SlyX family protein [Verrucomicrobiae bacterium]|nr:SlyX family protein [Verrucomicrobiae bacterium]
MENTEKRIIELEKKMAFQEHTIEQLNEVVILQQKKLEALERETKQLKQQAASGAFIKKPEEETPPPHY